MVKRLHELPSKDWWAVVTALRGPDFRPSWGLKCVFTARIRAWVASLFEGFDVCGFDTREGPITKALVEQAQFEAKALYLADEVWYSHWVSHVYAALIVLSAYLDDGGLREAQFLLTLLCSDPNDWAELFEREYGGK
jgi:hypothetical protein